MKIIEINKDNTESLFKYWNKIGKNVPYFYNSTYESFLSSLFNDTYEGITIFRENKVFIAKENHQINGFIQYGMPTFHFTETGKITEDINIGVIRNLYYKKTRTDIGGTLLHLALIFLKRITLKRYMDFIMQWA